MGCLGNGRSPTGSTKTAHLCTATSRRVKARCRRSRGVTARAQWLATLSLLFLFGQRRLYTVEDSGGGFYKFLKSHSLSRGLRFGTKQIEVQRTRHYR